MEDLPIRYEATSSDHFQLLLDRQMLALSPIGNIGQFVLTLSGNKIDEIVVSRLSSALIKWMYKLKYRSGNIWGVPKWISDKDADTSDMLAIHARAIDGEAGLNPPDYNLSPKRGGLFKVDLYKNEDNFKMIYTWHHTLSDARGAEYIALYICGILDELRIDELLPSIKPKPLLDLLQSARLAKNYLVAKREWIVHTLTDRKSASKSMHQYTIVDFTQGETETIEASSASVVRWGSASYLMAGCCVAYYKLVEKRGQKLESLMIPVPQDRRLKGSSAPILSNQVSYLFYRLLPEECQNTSTAAKIISKQMMTQIKERIPHAYSDMMELFKRIPLFIYDHLSKGPTKGKFASFYFSDTGDTLDQLLNKSEAPIKVLNAVHLPPPSLYPGCTIVFMKLNNILKIIISSTNVTMSDAERSSFISDLKRSLLYP